MGRTQRVENGLMCLVMLSPAFAVINFFVYSADPNDSKTPVTVGQNM